MSFDVGFFVGADLMSASAVGAEGSAEFFSTVAHPDQSIDDAIAILIDAARMVNGPLGTVVVALPAHAGPVDRVKVLNALSDAGVERVELMSVATAVTHTLSLSAGAELLRVCLVESGPESAALTLVERTRDEIRGLNVELIDSPNGIGSDPDLGFDAAKFERDVSEALGLLKQGSGVQILDYVFVVDRLASDRDLVNAIRAASGLSARLIRPWDISQGAALHAAALAAHTQDVTTTEVLSLPVGMLEFDEAGEASISELIFEGAELPATATFGVYALVEGQSEQAVAIVQGGAVLPDLAYGVGQFAATGTPAAAEGVPVVRFTIEVDGNGIIGVAAMDEATGDDLDVAVLEGPSVPAFCTGCGSVSSDGSVFCEECGTRIRSDGVPTNVPERQRADLALLREQLTPPEPKRIEVEKPVPAPLTVTAAPPKPRAATRFCTSCGRELPTSGLFCPFCGTSIQSAVGQAPAQVTPVEPDTAPFDPAPAAPEPVVEPVDDLRPCPFCAELIKAAAVKCRHCGEFLDPSKAPQGSTQPQPTLAAAAERHLFISHATEDADVAVAIAEALSEEGCRTWLATRDIQVGDNYASMIYEAIANASHLLVLLSPASVASEHVKREANLAITNKVPLLPLVVTEDTGFLETMTSDWKYWLGVVQVVPYRDAATSAKAVARRLAD